MRFPKFLRVKISDVFKLHETDVYPLMSWQKGWQVISPGMKYCGCPYHEYRYKHFLSMLPTIAGSKVFLLVSIIRNACQPNMLGCQPNYFSLRDVKSFSNFKSQADDIARWYFSMILLDVGFLVSKRIIHKIPLITSIIFRFRSKIYASLFI